MIPVRRNVRNTVSEALVEDLSTPSVNSGITLKALFGVLFSLLKAVIGRIAVFQLSVFQDPETERISVDADQHVSLGKRLAYGQRFTFQIFQYPRIIDLQIEDIVELILSQGVGEGLGRFETFLSVFPEEQPGA